jgi:hypothetical protein
MITLCVLCGKEGATEALVVGDGDIAYIGRKCLARLQAWANALAAKQWQQSAEQADYCNLNEWVRSFGRAPIIDCPLVGPDETPDEQADHSREYRIGG